MGDISAEPSMEEILSSIKRIIAEEAEPAPARPRRAPPRVAPIADPIDEHDEAEVLELNEPMPAPAAEPAAPRPVPAAAPAPAPVRAAAPDADTAPMVSHETLAATRGALESLSRLVTKPEPGSDGTLEGLVREMLRPMLSDWLDANLPAIVERLVAREVAKIAGSR